jgi:uncharacterized protein (TIGR00369 family)
MREELLNQLPAAHGGVLMTLLDSVMSRAAGELPGAQSQTAVTVEMSSRFHRPGKGALLAEGWVVHASRSLCSCAAQLLDEDGKLVATATGTFKYCTHCSPCENTCTWGCRTKKHFTCSILPDCFMRNSSFDYGNFDQIFLCVIDPFGDCGSNLIGFTKTVTNNPITVPNDNNS